MNQAKEAKWQEVKRAVRYREFEKRLHEKDRHRASFWTLALVAAIVVGVTLLVSAMYDDDGGVDVVPCHEPTGARP